MTPRATHLNHLSAAKMADLSARNQKRLHCIGSGAKNGSQAILARLPNKFKSEWHLWAEPEYLAMLDRNGIRPCIRTYRVNDNGLAWANE